jgi:hypothetical protein
MRAGGIRRPRGAVTFFELAVGAIAPDALALTRAIAGDTNEPNPTFYIHFTGFAEAISTSEGRFPLDFALGTTIIRNSVLFFTGTFMHLLATLL